MNDSSSEQELVSLSSRQRQVPLLQERGSQSNLHVLEEEALPEKRGQLKLVGGGMRRGPSYSDSFFFLPAASPSATSGFFLQDIPCQPLVSHGKKDAFTQTELPVNKTRAALIFKKISGFLFHIFLISIFENVFFFTFISKSEDQGILKTIGRYVDEVAESCAGWPHNETVFWNNLLSLVVNPQNVSAASTVSLNQRNGDNESLLIQSWIYTAGILGTVCVGGILGCRQGWLSRRTVKRILLENIGLVAMLGLYEFIFFRTIIYEYSSLSVPEIDEFAVSTLQKSCGLFT
jgi:hypothetical protein